MTRHVSKRFTDTVVLRLLGALFQVSRIIKIELIMSTDYRDDDDDDYDDDGDDYY